MSEFNYFKSNRVYNDIYFQYPKVFIYGEKYKSLSEGAKLAYMLLKHELTKAIEKEQVDDEGYIYFEMTVSYLATLMNCSERKVVRVKNELEKADLLKQVKMGFNTKTGKNNPNRLYLAELDVTDQDVYLMKKNAQSLDTSGSDKMAGCSQNPKTDESLDTSGSDKMAGSPKNAQSLDTSGSDKMAENVYKYTNSKKHKETKRYSEDPSQQVDLLLEGFAETMIESHKTFLPYRAVLYIEQFSNSFEEAYALLKSVHNAKANAEKIEGTSFSYERLNSEPLYEIIDLDAKVTRTIKSVFMTQKTESVKSLSGLMFTWATTCFKEVIRQKRNLDQLAGSNERELKV